MPQQHRGVSSAVHTPIHTPIQGGLLHRTRGVCLTVQRGTVHRTYVERCRVSQVKLCRAPLFFEKPEGGNP